MALLIDGYNLLHASGVFPARHLPGTLHNSRTALLEELVGMLPERELKQAIIVFDSAEAPPGLPNRINFAGLDVRFASDHKDADELIELLIDKSAAPRDLVVVSSDHRLHRAARRRRAMPIDSDVWFLGLRAMQLATQDERATAKPQHPLTEGEVSFWIKAFSKESESHDTPRTKNPLADEPQAGESQAGNAVDQPVDPQQPWPEPEIYNPFPPGYCDDLFEEE